MEPSSPRLKAMYKKAKINLFLRGGRAAVEKGIRLLELV